MKRNLLKGFATILVIALLFAPAPIALAQQNSGETTNEPGDRVDVLKEAGSLFSDSFRDNSANWELDESDRSILRIEAGAYHVDVLDVNTFSWGVVDQEVADFYLETDSFYVGGPENNEYGLVFRQVDAENFYSFMVSGDGFYGLRKMVAGQWSDLVEWTESDSVNIGVGSVNRIGVFAEGTQISALINGEVVAQVEDDSFASGIIGLAAGSFDEADVHAAFDDVALWDLADGPGPGPEPTPEEIATPEPTSVDVSERLAEVRSETSTVSEEFRRDTGAWTMDSDENVEYRIASRELSILVNKEDWMGWSINNEINAGDLLVEVDTVLADGPTVSEYGILFRYQDNQNFYFFAISSDSGAYSLWKEVDGEWTELVPWTESEAIETAAGSVNRLSALAEGSLITLLVNDEMVAQTSDTTFTGGQVALAVGTFDEPGAKVVFDNMDIWSLSDAIEPITTPEPLDTPEPIDTPEPAETPIISLDLTERLDEVRSSAATVTSEFRRDDGTWEMDADENVSNFYMRRALHIRVDRENWVDWSMHNDLSVADFLTEVDVAHVEGPLDGEYGLIFRHVDDENFYFYAISANGYYSLWKQVDGDWTNLIEWTASDELNSGEGALNRLGVFAEGDQITLLANGAPLQTLADDTHSSGGVGLTVGTFDNPGSEISFDNFSLWDLQQ